MFKVPIVFIIYKRIDTAVRVFETIKKAKPLKLYLVSDGPKNETEEKPCSYLRDKFEKEINWECKLVKVYSENNLGCAKRVQTGLDFVFQHENHAIILEDDTLPDSSFFNFCEILLSYYQDDTRVAHISGCNLHPDVVNFNESYCFSSIINIWGWATWKRAWDKYDINMSSWNKQNKDKFLSKWCSSKQNKHFVRNIFDIHSNNSDPWTWDTQWMYSCWEMNGISIIPSTNLVSNIGIGPDATNTKSNKKISMFPSKLESIHFPLQHPSVCLNKSFDVLYHSKCSVSKFRKVLNKILLLKKSLRSLIHSS